jgi:hypothetical protein
MLWHVLEAQKHGCVFSLSILHGRQHEMGFVSSSVEERGEGEGSNYASCYALVPEQCRTNPSPQSSPFEKGRGKQVRTPP